MPTSFAHRDGRPDLVTVTSRQADLQGCYGMLRRELEAAYSSLPWDSNRIDRITEELLPVERQIAMAQAARANRLETGDA